MPTCVTWIIIMKKCLLCGREFDHLARSHIFPWAFFKKLLTPNDLNSISSEGEGRHLRKALYDDDICCDECEHKILAPLDDYAVGVYRDKRKTTSIEVKHITSRDWQLIVFDSVDRKSLRAFFASLLFRCSVSNLMELSNVSIGNKYESRIRSDLLNKGDFSYVDAIGFHLTAEIHEGFILPQRKRLRINNRDANGYIVQMPHLEFRVSLDQKPNPYDFGCLDLSEIGSEGIASQSLSNAHLRQKFFLFQGEQKEYQLELMKQIWHRNKIHKVKSGSMAQSHSIRTRQI